MPLLRFVLRDELFLFANIRQNFNHIAFAEIQRHLTG
jgi:hypothetical protein